MPQGAPAVQQKWRTVRPWLPPSSSSSTSSPDDDSTSSKLRLEVLDVTSTAVALSVFTPSTDHSEHNPPLASSSTRSGSGPSSSALPPVKRSKPPQISIQLDRRPWPHVAHAGSLSTDSLTPGGRRGAETTVIVYGLEPGLDYEISLDVVGGDDGEGDQTVVEIETAGEGSGSRPSSETETATLDRDFTPTPLPHSTIPDGPPPPYSPSLTTTLPPDETQLRALLKKIRTSSKRTESVLNASISALKKSVEKGMKEDQRARTRIVSLEEAIRKAREGEKDMRTREREVCEERIKELERIEEEVKEDLARRKEGKLKSTDGSGAHTPVSAVPPTPPPPPPVEEAPEEEEGDGVGIADLAKELDALNKRIEEAETKRMTKAQETLASLEAELSQIENDLNQLDRDEAHRYNIAARLSSDSIDRIDAYRHQPLAPYLPPQPPSSSPFGLKWGRRTPSAATSLPLPPPQPQDPRSFGRFFRRNVSDTSASPIIPTPLPPPLPPSHAPDGTFHAQSFAQEQQALWASPHLLQPPVSTSPTSRFAATLRRRSTSLNSSAAAFGADGSGFVAPSSSSQRSSSSMRRVTVAEGEEPRDSIPEVEEKKESGGGWGRAWSQVVVRRESKNPVVAPSAQPEAAAEAEEA
ncbi:hypothetical protein P7C70_g917, partial [Phenoliferia sp. Uapishka_3]